MSEQLAEIADLVRGADSLVITAGAGMGVDSGLPDFRGNEGFWQAYPPYRKLGVSFIEMANPDHFLHDPAFGWGFYGHRLNLYRKTEPHAGFRILQDWLLRFQQDSFVVTSNVDGQFQRAGFSSSRIYEVHGSIHHLQCLDGCRNDIWPCEESVEVNLATMRAASLPVCARCGSVARPNILMFGDGDWVATRCDLQAEAFRQWWIERAGQQVLVIEMGAGTAIPTIRNLTERLAVHDACRAVRINPREPEIPAPGLSLEHGALDGLKLIEKTLGTPSG